MSGRILRSFSIALVALRLATALAEQPPLGPQQGVLLLRNGELIEGKITQAGDRYDVAIADGEMSIKRSEVELLCRDAHECYERKRAHLDAHRIQDHLDLAEWCLRHDLQREAASELAQSAAIDRAHPKLALLERRLKLAAQPTSPAGAPAPQKEPLPSSKELERMVREMPRGSIESFATTIQPLLSKQCSTAGCHGPQSSGSLRMLPMANGRSLTRRATLRNLNEVLKVVDRTNPAASPLLTAPLKPHGTCKTAVFSERDSARYQLLANWVHQVSSGHAAPASLDGSPNLLPQKYRSSRAEERAGRRRALQGTEAASEPLAVVPAEKAIAPADAAESKAPPATPPADAAELKTPPATPPDGRQPGPFVPKDPFDPEIFNRRSAKAR